MRWLVHTGRPSWHQARAGHISQGAMVFHTAADADAYAARYKALHPDEPAFILTDDK